MQARLRVARTNDDAACTFGAIDPAAKSCVASSSGVAVTNGRAFAVPQSTSTAETSVSRSRRSADSCRASSAVGQILVDHCFDTVTGAGRIDDDRNATTAGTHDHDAVFEQQLNGRKLHDRTGSR